MDQKDLNEQMEKLFGSLKIPKPTNEEAMNWLRDKYPGIFTKEDK